MKLFATFLFFLFFVITSDAQSNKTENVVIVTLDGMRWQEIFSGADPVLINSSKYVSDTGDAKAKYWNSDPMKRRQILFPFLWSTVAQQGQLYGNRNYGNNINVANRYQFSYPGYNEMFTGYPDTAVNSNDKIENKNVSVLEFINRQKGYEGKVAVFTTWDAFPYIFNVRRSGIYVNSDVDTFRFKSPQFDLLNQLQFLSPRPIGVRPDIITYIAGKEYLKEYLPKVLYIAFDETDDFAHRGDYEQYLNSAGAEDGMIRDLWQTLQSMPRYKDKTTLIVACDHGRGGTGKDTWETHGEKIKESGEIWIAVMGPDTQATGEQKQPVQLYQKQLAATISSLLGLSFKPDHEVAQPIESILKK